MKRRSRVHFAGALYYVKSRAVGGTDLFIDDVDRRAFIDTMNHCAGDATAVVLAYCLINSQIELAIKVSNVPLSSIMQRLLPGYCKFFNRRHDRGGHLFDARFTAVVCSEDTQRAKLVDYIHMIPVRAGLARRPENWAWSSYDARNGIGPDLSGDDPWRPAVNGERGIREGAITARFIADIAADVALRTGISIEVMRSGNRRPLVIQARVMVTREAVRNGYLLGRVAEWLHVAPCTMTRYFEKLCKEQQA